MSAPSWLTAYSNSDSGLAVLRAVADAAGATRSRTDLLRVLPGDSTDPHASLIRTVVKRGYALDLTAP